MIYDRRMMYHLATGVRKRAGIEDYNNGALRAILCRVVYDTIMQSVDNADTVRDSWNRRVMLAQEEVMLADMFAEDE
jgi:hypothetical protein